ncbi:MAG: glycogen/starch synthase [Planctomycetota bacterium]
MRIAFVTPEFDSLVRRTNLGSAAEALAGALDASGQDVRVLLPWTMDVDTDQLEALEEIAEVTVPDGPTATATVTVHRARLVRKDRQLDLEILLLDNDRWFRTRHPYGDQEGPYADNWRRFALLARAVLAALPAVDFVPDVLHCMDWTTGLIPLFHTLEIEADPDSPLVGVGTYFAIHNLAMQGQFEREVLPKIGIPHKYFRAIDGVELAGKVNYLKAGAEFGTILGTHSPGHAMKIQERDRGYGLETTFLRRKKELVGIHNGIDTQAWDPATDTVLPQTFKASDKELTGKRKCKAALQAALRLDNGPRTLLAASIGRWDADSGFDLLSEILTEVLERNVQLVIMGQGDQEVRQRLQTMEGAFMGRLRVVEGYNAHTAHLMMAGADILLSPSHYQPSNPLFAIGMRYGVVPVVFAHSGLEDTVHDYRADKRTGTGFHFDPYSSDGLVESLTSVIEAYKDAAKWKLLAKRCLNQDFSWKATAAEYLKAYRRVTRRAKGPLKSA